MFPVFALQASSDALYHNLITSIGLPSTERYPRNESLYAKLAYCLEKIQNFPELNAVDNFFGTVQDFKGEDFCDLSLFSKLERMRLLLSEAPSRYSSSYPSLFEKTAKSLGTPNDSSDKKTIWGYTNAIYKELMSFPSTFSRLKDLVGGTYSDAGQGNLAEVLNSVLATLSNQTPSPEGLLPLLARFVDDPNKNGETCDELLTHIINNTIYALSNATRLLCEDLKTRIREVARTLAQKTYFGFDPHAVARAIMNLRKVLYTLKKTPPFSSEKIKTLIGTKTDSPRQYTLCSIVEELLHEFYVVPLIKHFGRHTDIAETQSLLGQLRSLISNVQEKQEENEALAELLQPSLLGTFSEVLEAPTGSLYQKILLLHQALEAGTPFFSEAQARFMGTLIGEPGVIQPQTLFGEFQEIARNLSLGKEAAFLKEEIFSAKAIVNELLFSLHKNFFQIYFQKTLENLKEVAKKQPEQAQAVGLSEALKNLPFEALSTFFSDPKKTLRSSVVSRLYEAVGVGRTIQKTLSENISVLQDLSQEESLLQEHVGDVTDSRFDEGEFSSNTLRGNIQWIFSQIQEESNVLSYPYEANVLLNQLAREIETLGKGVFALTQSLDVSLQEKPSPENIEKGLQPILEKIESSPGKVKTLVHFLQDKDFSEGADFQDFFQKIGGFITDTREIFHDLTHIFPIFGRIEEGLKEIEWPHFQEVETESCAVEELRTQSFENLNLVFQFLENSLQGLVKKIATTPFIPHTRALSSFFSQIYPVFSDIIQDLKGQETFEKFGTAWATEESSAKFIAFLTQLKKFPPLFEAAQVAVEKRRPSYTIFQIANISRLLVEEKEAFKNAFLRPNIITFIENHTLDALFESFNETLRTLQTLFPQNLKPGQAPVVVRLEIGLEKTIRRLFSNLENFQHFFKDILAEDYALPPLYKSEAVYEASSLAPLLTQLAENVTQFGPLLAQEREPSLQKFIQEGKTNSCLLHNQVLLEKVWTFQKLWRALQKSLAALPPTFFEIASADVTTAQGALVQAFTTLKRPLFLMGKSLYQSLECAEKIVLLKKIAQQFGLSTELFPKVLAAIFSAGMQDLRTGPRALEKARMMELGEKWSSLEDKLSALGKKIRSFLPETSSETCFSGRFLRELEGVFQGLEELNAFFSLFTQAPLPEILASPVEDEDEEENLEGLPIAVDKDEIFPAFQDLARSFAQWSKMLDPYIEAYCAEFFKLFQPKTATQFVSPFDLSLQDNVDLGGFFALYDCLFPLAPTVRTLATSLENLEMFLEELNKKNVSLCNVCLRKSPTSHIRVMVHDVQQFLEKYLSLKGFLEPLQAKKAILQSFRSFVVASTPWGIGASDKDVFCRHSTKPELIIKFVPGKAEAAAASSASSSAASNPEDASRSADAETFECFPYYEYNGEQILWDKNGAITNADLKGLNIKDFKPLSLLSLLKPMEDFAKDIEKTAEALTVSHF
ncbi:hypothetical protein AGMMS49949_01920 [Alphaproteobacteria bacterium]|nr:hypothetical protein AGMMS49949_01920 [Alphaproteobacteria bacterium]GHS95784.1 hypothetical protein AGMMS50296_0910 [Alphaproteobacteria bacterium]